MPESRNSIQLPHHTTAHAELGGGNGHSRSAKKASAIMTDFFGHLSTPKQTQSEVAACGAGRRRARRAHRPSRCNYRVVAVVMVSSCGRHRRRSLTQRSTYSESVATRTASSGKNMKDLLHVTVGGGGLLRTAAVLTRAQVRRVPVPPVVLGVRFATAFESIGTSPDRGTAVRLCRAVPPPRK